MGIIRLTLFTGLGLAAGLAYLGRDEGLPDTRLGRVPDETLQDIDTVSFSAPTPDEITPDMTDTGLASAEKVEELTTRQAQPASLFTLTDETVEISNTPEGQTAPVTEAAKALFVSGSRVNVRGGPSTSYGVIASVTYGTEVQDLGDAGQGWRAIRLPSGDRGYMAARFLTETN